MNLKTRTKKIIPLIFIMGLVACGSKTSDSNVGTSQSADGNSTLVQSLGSESNSTLNSVPDTSVSENNSVPNSTSNPSISTGDSSGNEQQVITSWTTADKAIMNRVLGELLPVAPFYSYECTEEDIDGETVQIIGNNVTVASQYASILGSNGYTDGGVENEVYFYYKNIDEITFLDVEVYNDEGDTIILAYITIDEGSGEEDTPLTAWPSDISDYMMSTIGLVLPTGKFTSEFMDKSEPGNVYIYEDIGNAYPSYKHLLEAIGLTFTGSSTGNDEDLGDFVVYTHAKDNGDGTFVVVEAIQYEYMYFDIYAYIDDSAIIPPAQSEFLNIATKDLAATNGWISGNSYLSFSLDSNVSVLCAGIALGEWGLNSGKYYFDSGKDEYSYRIYQNESAKLTFSVKSGYELVSITLAYEYSSYGVVLSDSVQYASGSMIPASGQSIDLSVGSTTGGDKGNIQIISFAVTYAPI